jgi:hypothetical protein
MRNFTGGFSSKVIVFGDPEDVVDLIHHPVRRAEYFLQLRPDDVTLSKSELYVRSVDSADSGEGER